MHGTVKKTVKVEFVVLFLSFKSLLVIAMESVVTTKKRGQQKSTLVTSERKKNSKKNVVVVVVVTIKQIKSVKKRSVTHHFILYEW